MQSSEPPISQIDCSQIVIGKTPSMSREALWVLDSHLLIFAFSYQQAVAFLNFTEIFKCDEISPGIGQEKAGFMTSRQEEIVIEFIDELVSPRVTKIS